MVKKGSSNPQAIGLVNGSMAVAKQAAKVRTLTRTRHFMQARSEYVSSEQVLSVSQSPYNLGSQFAATTMLFAVSELSTNAIEWIQKHDKYRIKQIEVFATLTTKLEDSTIKNVPVEVYFYEDTDADPSTQTSWIRVMDRENLGRVVLNAFTPSMRLITFKPTVTFAAGPIDQNPANVVPKKDVWLDALSIAQLYSGLRLFACSPTTDSQGRSYSFSIALSARYTVEASQPL